MTVLCNCGCPVYVFTLNSYEIFAYGVGFGRCMFLMDGYARSQKVECQP